MMFAQTRQEAELILPKAKLLIAEALKYDFGSIVDFGCGFGLEVAEFAKAGRQAFGVDMAFCEEARKAAEANGYTLFTGSWTALESCSFDAGFSHHCLEHLRNPVQALHEWGRVIRPGGKLFLSLPGYTEGLACGHISIGWDTGKLAYALATAGWDCVRGRFRMIDKMVHAIVDRPDVLSLAPENQRGWGEEWHRLPDILRTTGNEVHRPCRDMW